MNNEHNESFFDLVDKKYILLSIISAIVVEYILIINESLTNFPSVNASIQLYVVITIIVLAIYSFVWRVQLITLLKMLGRTLLWIIPIGVILSYYQNYTNDALFNIDWLLTHDMVYVVLTAQTICLLILLAGLKDFVVVNTDDYF